MKNLLRMIDSHKDKSAMPDQPNFLYLSCKYNKDVFWCFFTFKTQISSGPICWPQPFWTIGISHQNVNAYLWTSVDGLTFSWLLELFWNCCRIRLAHGLPALLHAKSFIIEPDMKPSHIPPSPDTCAVL